MVEKAEIDARKIQTSIKQRLQEKQIRLVVGNGVSVSWTEVKGRETTDVKGLREAAENAGIDLDQYTSVADPSDRLTVTVKWIYADQSLAIGSLTCQARPRSQSLRLAILFGVTLKKLNQVSIHLHAIAIGRHILTT